MKVKEMASSDFVWISNPWRARSISLVGSERPKKSGGIIKIPTCDTRAIHKKLKCGVFQKILEDDLQSTDTNEAVLHDNAVLLTN